MTLVESLKKFLAKLGGDPTGLDNNATSAEVIDAISEAYTDKEGTYVEVTPIGSEGTKIATITTNNTPHDIYAPGASDNSYKYVKISPRNGLSLTITPSEDEDDPYDLYELSYTGYTASADGVTVHDEITTGIPVDYNTVVQIVDGNMVFNFITPVRQKVKNFRLTGMGAYLAGVPFALHIREISSYGISEPVNGVAFIDEMTASKLTFRVYKDSVTPTT